MASLGSRIKSVIDSIRLPAGYREKYEESSNGMAVFLSIVAAALIWFMISMRESYSVVRDFPVEFVNLAPDTAFGSLPPKSVRARVEGAGWQLLKLYTTSWPIEADAVNGTIDMFAAASRSLAPDLITQSVTPSEMTLSLEPRTRRKLPIRLRYDIEPVPPYDLVRPLVADPDSVEVSGARSVLSNLKDWPSEMLTLDRVNRSFVTTVGLADTLAGLVDKDLEQVAVAGDVSEFTENRRQLNVIVTGVPDGRGGLRLIPDQVSVTYRVPIDEFEASAVTDSFYATVSYRDILADTTGRVSPTIVLPPSIVVKDLNVETPRLQYYVVLD